MRSRYLSVVLFFAALTTAAPAHAAVAVGDLITPETVDKVSDLVSPGNLILVRQGMRMTIVAPQRIEWPPPYKSATEKYSSQVRITPDGAIRNYVAGLPFPLLDPNDPQVAAKVMWNFSFRPLYTDDVDLRYAEIASYKPGSGIANPVAHFVVGHFAFYNNVGRTEVAPVPTDPEALHAGIRYRFGAYPLLEPSELRGYGFIRYRHVNPKVEDNTWFYSPLSRRQRRVTAEVLSDAMGAIGGVGVFASDAATYASNLDPDTFFGFAAKLEDFDYKLLGIRPMLACMHAVNSPAKPCPFDGGRTICPENWEMRQLYVILATARKTSLLGSGVSIPKRIFYIDSETWLITASDQYDRTGQLWKTVATFDTYRDRPVPDARVAIYPFKREFQTALVDENVQNGFSTVLYTPARTPQERECWYINMGTVSKLFFDPTQLDRLGH